MGLVFVMLLGMLAAFLAGTMVGADNLLRRLRWHARRSALKADLIALERLIQSDREIRRLR